jgi:hypothetical protein
LALDDVSVILLFGLRFSGSPTVGAVELHTPGTTRQACQSTGLYSLGRCSKMDKTITVDQLATTDLRSINEIWLGGTHTQLCLWRGEQVFTHEMLSEGTHDQNVRRLCLQLVNLDDPAAVASVEVIARERLEKMGKEGEFYPAEEADTRQ